MRNAAENCSIASPDVDAKSTLVPGTTVLASCVAEVTWSNADGDTTAAVVGLLLGEVEADAFWVSSFAMLLLRRKRVAIDTVLSFAIWRA